jgi:hypothetical protein
VANGPTLLDQIKRTDPDGQIAEIVEALAERNPILQDAVAMEGNLPTGHRTTIRSGLPSIGWRRINQGTAASKSSTVQVDETCGLLNGRSETDVELARINGNQMAFRASEERSFMQQLNITAADAIMYASTKVNPERIHGFTPRFDSLSGGNGDNILNFDLFHTTAAVGNDQRSIWFITWGEDTCHLIYPKGTVGGIESRDMGEQYVEDPVDHTLKFLAWVTEWNWRLGLAIKDWRYIVRICNVDTTAAQVTEYVQTEPEALAEAMTEAYNRLYDLNTGRTVIYMSRQLKSYIERARLFRANVEFSPVDWHGVQVTGFRGLPIVAIDALNTDENLVA